MDLLTKLPAMPDAALSKLHDKAKRLEQAGSPAQHTAALLPRLNTEFEARQLELLAQARCNAMRRRNMMLRNSTPAGRKLRP